MARYLVSIDVLVIPGVSTPGNFWFTWLMAMTIGLFFWLSVMLMVYLINHFQTKKQRRKK